MESVTKAKKRFRQYPLILAKCKSEASNYAKCVLKRDNVGLNDCDAEFKLFRSCLQKTAATMKTKL